jgi:hypothetical protein
VKSEQVMLAADDDRGEGIDISPPDVDRRLDRPPSEEGGMEAPSSGGKATEAVEDERIMGRGLTRATHRGDPGHQAVPERQMAFVRR